MVTDGVTILVVDDDPVERSFLRAGFEAEGFNVGEADDAKGALSFLERLPVMLVTLDLQQGHHERLALARKIKSTHNIPIIIITKQGEPHQRVEGLEHGADDYILKPFQMREVIIRARSCLDRYSGLKNGVANGRYTFDHSVLDTKARLLRHSGGSVIELTETEYQLLELFLQHPDRVLSRDELWKLLRGHEWSPFDRAIDGHISRLRHKIECAGGDMIKSVRGVGYVFTGDVVRR